MKAKYFIVSSMLFFGVGIGFFFAKSDKSKAKIPKEIDDFFKDYKKKNV